MPRARAGAIADSGIVDESLPGMPADPQPVTRRPPGRPRGSKTVKKAAPAKIIRDSSSGRAMSKAQAKAKVATELYGVASLMVGMWEMRDPDCAGVWTDTLELPSGTQERLAAVVERVVDIFARNDAVLSAMATTGILGEVALLGSLIWPALKKAWQHHGPNGVGHGGGEEAGMDYARQYPAPSLV
jgi:hypothetical protein